MNSFTIEVRPTPVGPIAKMLNPLLSIPIPNSIASIARSCPITPFPLLSSVVERKEKQSSEQVQRTSSAFNSFIFFLLVSLLVSLLFSIYFFSLQGKHKNKWSKTQICGLEAGGEAGIWNEGSLCCRAHTKKRATLLKGSPYHLISVDFCSTFTQDQPVLFSTFSNFRSSVPIETFTTSPSFTFPSSISLAIGLCTRL